MSAGLVLGPVSGVPDDLEALEVELLLEAIHRRYDFDFRQYAMGSLKRRLRRRMEAEGLGTLSALQDRVLHDRACMERLLMDLSINVTAMFRDPSFWLAFRQRVVPTLRTYPFLRVWIAGCSTGEEAYSLAIVLEEAGLYDRTRIYATDLNGAVLISAEQGVLPLRTMRDYTENYVKAGGVEGLSKYYTAAYDGARLRPRLLRNIVFAQHNLVSDRSFNEFNVVICRNVLIYFGPNLQGTVLTLFHESLATFGVLGLGHKESLRFSPQSEHYQELDAAEKLYRRIR